MMDPKFVLLLGLLAFAFQLTISETAAIVVSETNCVGPNGTETLSCLGYFTANTEENLHWHRLFGGPTTSDARWLRIDKGNNPDKFEVVINSTTCRTKETNGQRWIKRLDLDIKQVTASDAGVYGCGTGEHDIVESRLTVSNYTDFRLSSSRETLKLEQSLSIEATAGCKLDGTLRVVKTNSNGISAVVGYGPLGQDVEPYVSKEDGTLVIPKFRCEDAGIYEVTYTLADGLEPVDTKKTVHIKGESCTTHKHTTTPYESDNKDSGASVEEKTNGNVAVSVLAFLLAIMTLVCVILSVVIWKKQRENRIENGGTAGEQNHLQTTSEPDLPEDSNV